MKVQVRCIQTYKDKELKTQIKSTEEDKNYIREVSKERADVLVAAGVCEIIGVVKEEKIETAKLDVKKETTKKETKSKKKANK